MPRLIDGDALIERLEVYPVYNGMADMDDIMTFVREMPTIGGWTSVKDGLPVETHSIFYPFYGTKKWSRSMWREQSHKVLVTVAFKDGSRTVTTGETHDGVWNTTISRTLEPVVTHWMPLPEPPKEESLWLT